jgi:hypothetical protein
MLSRLAQATGQVLTGTPAAIASVWPRRVQARPMTSLGNPDPPLQGHSRGAESLAGPSRWIPIMAAHRAQDAGRREACIAGLPAEPVKLCVLSGDLQAHFFLP